MNTFDKTVQSLCFEIDDLKRKLENVDFTITSLKQEKQELIKSHQEFISKNLTNWLELFGAAKIDRENGIMTVDINKLNDSLTNIVPNTITIN
jgi:FtsZ-binding cell division protein ZapB